MMKIIPDRDYRRNSRAIIIAQLSSLIPKGAQSAFFSPRDYGVSFPQKSFQRVRQGFSKVEAEVQLPFHYYVELIGKEYEASVGCPLSNRSWWAREMVSLGVLDSRYIDSPVIVLQEDFSVETGIKSLWEFLSHFVVTPILKMENININSVDFFELVADQKEIEKSTYPYNYRYPRYLDPFLAQLAFKKFQKR